MKARFAISSLLLGGGVFYGMVSSAQAFVGFVSPISNASTLARIRRRRGRFLALDAAYSSNNNPTGKAVNQARRQTLLSRKGPHFKLERMSGLIEFGATANLVTQLEGIDSRGSKKAGTAESIAEWLEDERGLAMSIWDPKLMKELGNSVYRLQIMTLQFVTLQLAPSVDMQMKTVTSNDEQQQPVFTLQSVSFDPNIQLLPGLKINAESLGIVIEVGGILRPGADGKSVTGAIAFQTTGVLPPPMRLLPEPFLKATSDSINNIVVSFATQSFQKGAKANFKEFLIRRQLGETQE